MRRQSTRSELMTEVLVADGHPTTRFGLKRLLETVNSIEVTGEYDNTEEVLRLMEKLDPDLVVMDLNLKSALDGTGVCRRIKELAEAPRILAYADQNFVEGLSSCLIAGVDSYLHKRSTCEEFLDAIRRTVAGERVWKIEEHFSETKPATCADLDDADLTPRERDVITLKLHHYTNSEIAAELYISIHTVKHHLTSVYRKLGRTGKDLLRSQPRL